MRSGFSTNEISVGGAIQSEENQVIEVIYCLLVVMAGKIYTEFLAVIALLRHLNIIYLN